MKEIWLLVGKEVDGNIVKRYMFISENGMTQFVTKRGIPKFCREHNVINVQLSGNSIAGKGISLNGLPKYSNNKEFGLTQIGGISQAEVIQCAQPLINQYRQKLQSNIERNYIKTNNNINNNDIPVLTEEELEDAIQL